MLTFLDYKNFFTGDVVFFKEKVGSGKQSTISVNQAIERLDKNDMPVFFKIDIEGSEYVILDQLISNNKDIIGLVIEFHYVGKNQNKIEKFINLFPLELVHIHPNNNRKTDDKGDPNTLEMTFAKSPKMLSDKLVLPNELDQKNVPLKDEINLNFLSRNCLTKISDCLTESFFCIIFFAISTELFNPINVLACPADKFPRSTIKSTSSGRDDNRKELAI